MSIQEEQSRIELVECYEEFTKKKKDFNDAIQSLNVAITNLEALDNYETIASDEEKALVTEYENKIEQFKS